MSIEIFEQLDDHVIGINPSVDTIIEFDPSADFEFRLESGMVLPKMDFSNIDIVINVIRKSTGTIVGHFIPPSDPIKLKYFIDHGGTIKLQKHKEFRLKPLNID
tara:strand:+ start:184 stop:495 length:312 start_codon:yes stop_codon:yes gene_type:complete